MFALAMIAAALAATSEDMDQLAARMLTVDIVSLVLKVTIAVHSRRRWPIWVAAFQLNTVLAQLAIFISPSFMEKFYYAMATIWAVPSILALAAGTFLDRRFEKASRTPRSLER